MSKLTRDSGDKDHRPPAVLVEVGQTRVSRGGVRVNVAGYQLVQVHMKLYAYRMMVNVTGGYLSVSLVLEPAKRMSHMWMNRLVTLSSE